MLRLNLVCEWMPSTAACMDCGSVLGAVTKGGKRKKERERKAATYQKTGYLGAHCI